MNIDQLRKFCLSFPGTTEQIQWGDNLLFKVGGKMFAITSLEPAAVWLSLKADPEEFAELTERPGIIPAPYLARAKWIALESPDALIPPEVERLVRKSYELVLAKLPRKKQAGLVTGRAKPQSGSKGPAKSKRAASRKRRQG